MVMLEEQTQAAPPAGTGQQKERAVQRMFSSIARYYDLNNTLLSLGLHHSWKRQAVGFREPQTWLSRPLSAWETERELSPQISTARCWQ